MSSDRNAIQQLADQLRQLLWWQGRGAIFLVKWATSVVGTNRTWRDVRLESAFGGRADVICSERVFPVLTPERTSILSEGTILARSTPSRMKVWPDKMAFLTLGVGMARLSRTGGKASGTKTRKAKVRIPGKNTRIPPTANRSK